MQVPAAVSPLTRDIVMGPARAARVLAVFPTAVYLAVYGGRSRMAAVLPVVTSDALLLPTSLRLGASSGEVAWPVCAGDAVVVGAGRVVGAGLELRAVREWRPSRVGVLPVPGRAAADGVGYVGVLADLCADLVRAALDGRTVEPHVHGLVGAGAGLTPSGDDALCGVLLALRAWGRSPEPFAAVVGAVARSLRRTNDLSASLLRAAAEGYAVPQVVSLVEALSRSESGAESGAGRSVAVTALEAVHAIGHSSGRDLVAGLVGALHSIESARSPIEGARSPIEGARSPIESARSPIESARSPIEGARFPFEGAGSPFEGAGSPIESAGSPIESAHFASPLRKE